MKILDKIENSAKVALICNDFIDGERSDILNGEYMGINMRKEPFRKYYKIVDMYTWNPESPVATQKAIYVYYNK